MKSTIELMYSKGDKKFKYDTRKQRQVQQVIMDLKETKLNYSKQSVFEQILRGERIVTGTPKRQSAMEQPDAQEFKITEGIVPPEEQFQQFLMDERYERRQIFMTVAGGSYGFYGVQPPFDYMSYRHMLYEAWDNWIEAWRTYWLSTSKLWAAYCGAPIMDAQDSSRRRPAVG